MLFLECGLCADLGVACKMLFGVGVFRLSEINLCEDSWQVDGANPWVGMCHLLLVSSTIRRSLFALL